MESGMLRVDVAARRRVPIIFTVFCALLGVSPCVAAQDDATQLLKQAEAATAWLRQCRIATRVHYRFDNDGSKGGSSIVVRQYYALDGRVHIKVDSTDEDAEGKAKRPQMPPIQRETIFSGSRHVIYYPTSRIVITSRVPEEGIRKWRAIDRCDVQLGSFLEGRATFGELATSIFEVASHGSIVVLSRSEMLEGVECVKLGCDTPQGQLRIWIAPSRSYCVLRYEFDQQDIPQGIYKTSKVVFNQAKLIQQAGRYFVASGQYQGSYVAKSRDVAGFLRFTETAVAERTEIDTSPRFDEPNLFTFADIPNGAFVTLENETPGGVLHVWEDGQIVPFIDSRAIKSIDSELDTFRATNVGKPEAGPGRDKLAPQPSVGHKQSSRSLVIWAAVSAVLIAVIGWVLVFGRSIRVR